MPIHFYDKAMLGLDGRDEQIAKYQGLIREVGRAGIPILGYHFMPNSVWRTTRTGPGRGGAQVTAFNMALVEAAAGGGAERLRRQARREARRALGEGRARRRCRHRGADVGQLRVLHARRAADRGGGGGLSWPCTRTIRRCRCSAEWRGSSRMSPDSGSAERNRARHAGAARRGRSNLCLGCCSEMPGGATNVRAMIEHFGPRGRIAYIHFRDVKGDGPRFRRVLHRRGELQRGGDDAPAEDRAASPASCSTITSRT